jgi:serine/threonine protein kinase
LYEQTEISGHAALFMAVAGVDIKAGAYTLAQRLRSEGRLSLDLLQRLGDELLTVTDWLEQNGISHRDIKPDNISVGQTPSGKLTLILFDFSLANTPLDNIRAGTPPYLDPFLRRRQPPPLGPIRRALRRRHDAARDGDRGAPLLGRWRVRPRDVGLPGVSGQRAV